MKKRRPKHRCRKCNTTLKGGPTDNYNAAFCTKGCFESYYHFNKRCVRCERPTGRKTERKQWLCERRVCKIEFKKFPAYYLPFHLGSMMKVSEASIVDRKTMKPDFNSLRMWTWVRCEGSDDDWDIINQKSGNVIASIRQEGNEYWVAKPKAIPIPPLEHFPAAKERAQQYALVALRRQ